MLSLLIVNYRSAPLAAAAIRSARAATSQRLQVVVVDNSLDGREAEALRAHADVLLVSATNRGYAGAINDGRAHCDGDVLLVANPDVVFEAGSLDRLAAELHGRVAVAGPSLFWDAGGRWMLPPADRCTTLDRVDRVLASRSPRWHEQRERRRFRERIRFWRLRETTEVGAVSGAVMAIRPEDFDAAGGFDERFALYFEETDFFRRLAGMRRAIVVVPAARCRHAYNQSAGQVAATAAERYAESERRYLEKWSGPFAARLLQRLERSVGENPEAATDTPEINVPDDGLVVEASPLADFATAAGCFPHDGERRVAIPPEVWEAYRGEALHLRVIDPASGSVIARLRAVK